MRVGRNANGDGTPVLFSLPWEEEEVDLAVLGLCAVAFRAILRRSREEKYCLWTRIRLWNVKLHVIAGVNTGVGEQLVERSVLTFRCTVGGKEEKSWQSSRLKLSKGDIFVLWRGKIFLGGARRFISALLPR